MKAQCTNSNSGEPRGVSLRRNERVDSPETPTQPQRPPGAGTAAQPWSAPGSLGNQLDESLVFPGDHTLDDPALLEMLPPRSQRELDLEALDYHSQGYTVRQIGKLQNVHVNTAFKRLKRGREIDARDPLRAEGASLHAQVYKLRRLERAIFPAAEAGDLRTVQTVLRIWDRLMRLGKLAAERQEEPDGSPAATGKTAAGKLAAGKAAVCTAAESRLPPELLTMLHGGATIGQTVAHKTWAAEALPDDALLPWDFMLEMLPHREAEIAALREEFCGVIAADEENWRKQQAGTGQAAMDSPCDSAPDRSESAHTGEPPGVSPRSSEPVGGSEAPTQPQQPPPPAPAAPGAPRTLHMVGRQSDSLDNFMAEYGRPGFVHRPDAEPSRRRRPLTRKEKALQARARREQRVGAPLAPREQSASADMNNRAKNAKGGTNGNTNRDGPSPVP